MKKQGKKPNTKQNQERPETKARPKAGEVAIDLQPMPCPEYCGWGEVAKISSPQPIYLISNQLYTLFKLRVNPSVKHSKRTILTRCKINLQNNCRHVSKAQDDLGWSTYKKLVSIERTPI